ncbi:MAG TPA: hypothetical protein DCL38_04985, partial [Lachnospiraceae bacterium]|nr:hypothetical protein [Lachnospiraceae bacterium]
KGGSRKKQEPSGEAQGRDRNENIYLRYEQENTGREENRSRESEAYAQTQADVSERRRRAVIINMVIILAEVIVLGIVLFNLFKYKRLLEESDFSAAGAG